MTEWRHEYLPHGGPRKLHKTTPLEQAIRHLAPRFEFEGRVEGGGMSAVYRARPRQGGSPVAIKIMAPVYIPGAALNEFAGRTQLCLALDHPNLVRVLEAETGTWGGTEPAAYLVMEWLSGTNLRRHLMETQTTLTIGALVELFRQTAAGIDALHRGGIIHRDIKPDNVFVTAQRTAKVGDYGFALGIREIEEKAEADVFGTPAYMAPEQIIGTSFGPQVDIYAFAILVYTLLSRSLPFEAATTRDLIFAHIHKDPIPLRQRNRSWPHELDRVLARSMSKHWDQRHPYAQALADDIAAALRPFTPFRLSSFFDGSLSRFSSGEIPVDF